MGLEIIQVPSMGVKISLFILKKNHFFGKYSYKNGTTNPGVQLYSQVVTLASCR